MGLEEMKQKDDESRKLTKEQKAEIKANEKARILRNKGWDELNQDEKMERMRNKIKDNHSSLYRQISDLQRKISQLENHSHKENGDVVVPFNRYSSGAGYGTAKSLGSQKVYF